MYLGFGVGLGLLIGEPLLVQRGHHEGTALALADLLDLVVAVHNGTELFVHLDKGGDGRNATGLEKEDADCIGIVIPNAPSKVLVNLDALLAKLAVLMVLGILAKLKDSCIPVIVELESKASVELLQEPNTLHRILAEVKQLFLGTATCGNLCLHFLNQIAHKFTSFRTLF